jgi:transposase
MSKETIYKNALITETLSKLSPKDKQEIITTLLKNKSERQLSKELNIPRTTIHDWKTLRQNNTGKDIHISLSGIHRKLSSLKAEEITDWGRIEQIWEIINKLLLYNKK